MENTRKKKKKKALSQKAHLRCAVFFCVMGCLLIIAGFVVPPLGNIHPSVLVAFGEFLTFAGALFGIDYKYKFNINNEKN